MEQRDDITDSWVWTLFCPLSKLDMCHVSWCGCLVVFFVAAAAELPRSDLAGAARCCDGRERVRAVDVVYLCSDQCGEC